MAKALEIYNDLCDLDAGDYLETFESDILYIRALVDAIGEHDARAYLTQLLTA